MNIELLSWKVVAKELHFEYLFIIIFILIFNLLFISSIHYPLHVSINLIWV